MRVRAEEECPKTFPGVGTTLAWSFDDPKGVTVPEEEMPERFRQVRYEIKINDWLDHPEEVLRKSPSSNARKNAWSVCPESRRHLRRPVRGSHPPRLRPAWVGSRRLALGRGSGSNLTAAPPDGRGLRRGDGPPGILAVLGAPTYHCVRAARLPEPS